MSPDEFMTKEAEFKDAAAEFKSLCDSQGYDFIERAEDIIFSLTEE